MKLLFLMILLTRNGAGDLNAAFVNTQTLEGCQQRMLAVKGIFLSAGVDIVEGRCLANGLRFSEFEHAVSSRQQRYFFTLSFSADSVAIESQPDWGSCMHAARKQAPKGGVHCASSVQRLLSE